MEVNSGAADTAEGVPVINIPLKMVLMKKGVHGCIVFLYEENGSIDLPHRIRDDI